MIDTPLKSEQSDHYKKQVGVFLTFLLLMQNVPGKNQNILEAFFHAFKSSKIIETICLIFPYMLRV